jgi:hypothetical protein
MNITIGTDPEFFVVDTMGKYIPPKFVTKGTKKIPQRYSKGVIHQDAAAVEFSILPCDNAEDFSANIQEALDSIFINPYFKMYPYTSIKLDDQIISMDSSLSEVGCQPDYKFIESKRVKRKLTYNNTNWRMAGGHIHIGIGFIKSDSLLEQIITDLDNKFMSWYREQDFYHAETEAIREAHYGDNGVFRQKKYGLEYRTPSMAWIKTHEDRVNVFNKIYEIVKPYSCIVSEEKEKRDIATTRIS